MNLCECGCGNATTEYRGKYRRFVRGHNYNRKGISKYPDIPKDLEIFCKTCGKKLEIKPHHKYLGLPKYCHGHNPSEGFDRGHEEGRPKWSDEDKKRIGGYKFHRWWEDKGTKSKHKKSTRIANQRLERRELSRELMKKNGKPHKKGEFHHTKDTRQILREQMIKRGSTPEGKEIARKGYLSLLKSGKMNQYCNTRPEKYMKRCLEENGIYYKFQYPITIIKHCYVADFYLPLYNIILEVDGKWCHHYPDGLEIDRIRTDEMEEAGYRVLRFWEGEFDAQIVWREI